MFWQYTCIYFVSACIIFSTSQQHILEYHNIYSDLCIQLYCRFVSKYPQLLESGQDGHAGMSEDGICQKKTDSWYARQQYCHNTCIQHFIAKTSELCSIHNCIPGRQSRGYYGFIAVTPPPEAVFFLVTCIQPTIFIGFF